MVVIAQLAEHRIVVPSVVGSSPTLHPGAFSRRNGRSGLRLRGQRFSQKISSFMVADFCFSWTSGLARTQIHRGPREFLILGESVAQGENVLQGLCPQSREP